MTLTLHTPYARIDLMADEWTTQQCAEYLGIKPRTWNAYVNRPTKTNPAPQPLHKVGPTPVWDPEAVKTWAANRQRSTNS